MSLKQKLLYGFSSIMLIVVVLAFVGAYMLSHTAKDMEVLVEDQYQKISDLSDLRLEFNQIARLSGTYLLTTTDSQQENIATSIDTSKRKASIILANLTNTVDSTEGIERLSEVRSNHEAFLSMIDREMQLVQAGENEDAMQLFRSEIQPQQTAYLTSITNLVKFYEVNIERTMNASKQENTNTLILLIALAVIGIIAGSVISSSITRSITKGFSEVTSTMKRFAAGDADLATRIDVQGDDEIATVATSFNQMAESIEKKVENERQQVRVQEEQAWMAETLSSFTNHLQEYKNFEQFTYEFVRQLTPHVEGEFGLFYRNMESEDEPVFKVDATFGVVRDDGMINAFRLNEGLVGRVAAERTAHFLTEVPSNYSKIVTGSGSMLPTEVALVPIVFEGRTMAVFEIASARSFTSIERTLMEKIADTIGIMMENIESRMKLVDLLQESQTMTEELQVQSEELASQHDELKRFNEELERQTAALLQSEQQLQQQQEELEHSNSELEEKAALLEEHNQRYEMKNREVEEARKELEEKARQLEITSKYKSEFLANMSHELRTPLNSLLILSKLLSDNKPENLSEKQIEFAQTIHSAGCDLLDLINEILDLSKIESGQVEVTFEKVPMEQIVEYVKRTFAHVAYNQSLEFHISLQNDLPETIRTDGKRLQQILKNLLANAFKFTSEGSVSLDIAYDEQQFIFSVVDTGIGIPHEKHDIIFEAFQQVDGTTSRKYGGTGLGLSISREQARLLGGTIKVVSTVGAGSQFILTLPEHVSTSNDEKVELLPKVDSPKTIGHMEDPASDNSFVINDSESGQRVLIVEDNRVQRNSMRVLLTEKFDHLHVSTASSGERAIQLLEQTKVDCIIVDLGLEDMNGLEFIHHMKEREELSTIPILIYTGKELTEKEDTEYRRFTDTIIIKGARSHERLVEEVGQFILDKAKQPASIAVAKPTEAPPTITKEDVFAQKQILIVDDDVRNVFALSSILENYDMEVVFAENGKEAIDVLTQHPKIDLILMDIMMPEMDGYEAMKRIRQMDAYKDLPIIALTAKAMKEDRQKCIDAGASDYISKPIMNDQLLSLMRVWLYT